MTHDPPTALHAPPRPDGSGRRAAWLRRSGAILVVGPLALMVSCGRSAPATPPPGTPDPGSAAPAVEAKLDGLLVASGGPLLVSDAGGGLVAVDSAAEHVDAVTASAGVIVAIDRSGQAAILDTTSPGGGWTALSLPTDPSAAVRLATLAPSGTELAVVAGDPQGSSFVLTILELRTRAVRAIPAARGLNGPPSWLGGNTIAVDVIRDAGHSGIATIDLGSGDLTDRPGPGSVVASSIDGAHLALDDPATGDVLLGDVVTWQAGGVAAMLRIHGPPATGVEGLAMSADGTRLAVVRRSDAGGSIEILVRLGDEWRTVRTLSTPGDAPIAVAWRE